MTQRTFHLSLSQHRPTVLTPPRHSSRDSRRAAAISLCGGLVWDCPPTGGGAVTVRHVQHNPLL